MSSSTEKSNHDQKLNKGDTTMPTQIKGTTYYTTEEAGEMLGVQSESVRMYIRAGKLRGFKYGKKYFILDSDLMRMITAGEELSYRARLKQIADLMSGVEKADRSAYFENYYSEVCQRIEELDRLKKQRDQKQTT